MTGTGRFVRRGVALSLAAALAGQLGCAALLPHATPAEITTWQLTGKPTLTLAAKARVYQERLEARHQTADGLIRYKFREVELAQPGHGNFADGSYFLGIYLGSQALRYAVTGDPAARAQITLSLQGMRLYAEVSGRRGLLARYYSPTRPDDERWLPSTTHPGYFWRSDVSKDQYSGYVHGLAVCLAVVQDPAIRAEAGALAEAIASHLIENDLRVIDWDGERTRYGDLRARLFGIPIGVNALISLAIARAAVEASPVGPYSDFHRRLVADGYPRVARWAHLTSPGSTKRVNYNMAYLALYPQLLLERDPALLGAFRGAEERLWRRVQGEQNAFFAFVHGVASEASSAGAPEPEAVQEAAREGRSSLLDFPDRKLAWPVDLTRPGFDFPRRIGLRPGNPRSRTPVPMHLRTRSSNMWSHDPYSLVGRLESRGELEFAGIDYLSAYWIGRYHGFLGPDD